ncbi:uncharacterized protein LOC127717519 isoform X1 [Mytilus californianus]|uniref:uncharacterized protein LOC127717519 isoform X1 n=1 Tax=Mytilus californianus TaxID=6549 RepID=UPI0022467776|nr:uncharacterized protein LOC127717519 isoform X1 [Mytilus californianus]
MTTKFRQRASGGKSVRHLIDQVKIKPALHKVTYDSRARGWIGPQKETHSKWVKARGAVMFLGIRNATTRPRIDVASLVRATKNKMSFSKMTYVDKDDSIQVTLRNPSFISRPFDTTKSEGAVWTSPKPIGSAKERSKYFSFDRPKTSDRTRLSSAVSSHQAQYLKKILQEKEKELQMMQKLLSKSTDENSKLSKELEGYQGKNYDEIYLENLKLKESISRVSKENVILRGQLQQERNPAVQRMLKKENLLRKQNTL